MHHGLGRGVRLVGYSLMMYGLMRNMCISKYRLQDVTQQSPSSQYARFHCANRYFQHFSHLFVSHSFEVSEDYGTAENFRNTSQGLLDCLLQLVGSSLLERGPALILDLQKR